MVAFYIQDRLKSIFKCTDDFIRYGISEGELKIALNIRFNYKY